MPLLHELARACRQPFDLLIDPAERLYWPLLLSALALPMVLLGVRSGVAALRRGLLRLELWTHASSRADALLLFVRALLAVPFGVGWVAATTSAALGVSLWLHAALGPGPAMLSGAGAGLAVTLIYTVVLFVAWDASRYLLHRLMHDVPALWRLHQVHHSAEVLTPLTLYRVHPLESLLYDLRGLVVTAAITGVFGYVTLGTAAQLQILGVNALVFGLNVAGGNLRHSHVWLGFGRAERWLISPAMHQIHHARDMKLSRSNYGTWLSCWDRWGGTFVPSDAVAPNPAVGLDEANHRFDGVGSMLVGPLVDLGRAAGRRWRTSRRAAAGLVPGLVVFGVGTAALAAPPSDDEGVDFELDAGAEDPPADFELDGEAEEPPADFEFDDGEAEADGADGADENTATDDGDPPTAPAPDPGDMGFGDEDTAALEIPEGPAADEDLGRYDVMTDEVSILGRPGEQSRVAGSAHVVDEEQLEREEPDDIHRVLRNVPGVYIREEDGFGLRPNIGLRGASSDRSAKVTLMEDGVLLGPAPYAAPAAYYFPIVTRMTGVEVFKGPAALRYGPNTIGGAINLQTRPIPRDMRGGIDIGAGMRGYGKAHGWWGTSTDHFGVLGEAVHVRSNGFKELDGGGNTGFGRTEMMLKGRWHVDPARPWYHQIDVRGGVSLERSNETYLGLTRDDFERTPYRRYAASQKGLMEWWRTQGRVDYFVAKGSFFEATTTLYRHDFSRAWRKFNAFRGADPRDVLRDPDVGQNAVYYAILTGEEDSLTPQQTLLIGTNDRQYFSQGIAETLRFHPTPRGIVEQNIEFGARLHHDQIRRHHFEDGFVMRSGFLIPEGTDRVDTTRNEGEALAGAFHVVDEITVSRATLTPGMRVEVVKTWFEDRLADSEAQNLNAVFLPGVGLYVQTTDWLGVLGGVHTGYSPVAPGQSQEVKPEQSLNYEAGARVMHRARRVDTQVEAVGFFNNYQNLTSECTFSSGCDDTQINQQFNAGAVWVYGVEATARERFALPRRLFIEVGLAYTYTDSRFLTSFSSGSPALGDVEEGDKLPYVPEHTGGGSVVFGGQIFSIDVGGAVVGEMRDLPSQGAIPEAERVPLQLVLDLGARVQITKHASIYSSLDNMIDRVNLVSYRPFGARPGMPIQFMLGFKYDFFRES